jgi:GDPmannose 4,6-dehydratase
MPQQDKPDDCVFATNKTCTIGTFLDAAFSRVNLDWHDYVKFDERFLRPAEVDLLIGDYAKAKAHLGWEPKTRMKALADLMVDADLASLN